MTEIAHAFVEQATRQTHTGDEVFTDISGAAIGSGSFTTGDKYLICVMSQMDGSTAAGNTFGITTLHGTTEFAESRMATDPNADTASRFVYFWFTVWTAVASEGIKLQHRTYDSASTVGNDSITLMAINLSNDLTENTDWHFAEDATNHTVGTAYGDAEDASITFTPGTASDDWLVLFYSQINPSSAVVNFLAAINRSGEATSTLPEISQEPEGGQGGSDRLMLSFGRVFNLGASSNTFKSQARNDGAGEEANRDHNAVFALNLNKFKVHANGYTEGTTALSATDFATEVQSISITPTVTGDVWYMAFWQFDANSAGRHCKSRMQMDGADKPADQTQILMEAWDVTDQLGIAHQYMESLTNAAHTLDVDASAEDTGADAAQRSAFAVTMELDAAAVVDEVGFGMHDIEHGRSPVPTSKLGGYLEE